MIVDLFGTSDTPVMHPGWACCDPNQDLAGWIVRQRARIERDGRWVAVLHQRGRRLNAASIGAYLADDHRRGQQLDADRREAHGRANAIGQRMLILAGHVDRVEAAHTRAAAGADGR